ncbi:FHA domain-containing protein [Microbacterium karelineae]|uniref:FHA domain-containing protein n=1 Tax=Microbacterium karelineae TaxID=2654283 RepID=UPI0012E994CA|nr:FHA domain-containing protein [Microbacterium karelineae]
MASARCVHCRSTLEPNSMYCLGCGQLIGSRIEREEVDEGWRSRPRPTRRQPDPAPAAEDRTILAPEPPLRRRSGRSWPARVELRFSTGFEAIVGGSAVIGRKPEQAAANMGAQAIEIDDTTRSMSRVHLYLSLDGGHLRIGDAGSSNGSTIERGTRTIPLEGGGEHREVLPGDVVTMGDVRISITPA